MEQIEKFLIDDIFQKQVKEVILPDQNEAIVSQNSQTPSIRLKKIELVNFRGFSKQIMTAKVVR